MIVLSRNSRFPSVSKDITLVFGVGLIGIEIVKALTRAGYSSFGHEFSWTDRLRQKNDAANIVSRVRAMIHEQRLSSAGNSGAVINIVWAAGKCGFSSTYSELEEEEHSFHTILDIYRSIEGSVLCRSLKFHLVSSAGGLFESQKLIDEDSLPEPCRPYGAHKLELEKLLQRVVGRKSCFIYRPSSVYGFISGGRFGFIATLIKNGLLNKEIQILGTMGTLRDYVFSGDIGEHIAKKIISNSSIGSIDFLASGKPTSILQLKHIVEQVINKKIYICCSAFKDNQEDITFKASSLPDDWQATEISLGVRKVYVDFF